jgi:hypothetical protein
MWQILKALALFGGLPLVVGVAGVLAAKAVRRALGR